MPDFTKQTYIPIQILDNNPTINSEPAEPGKFITATGPRIVPALDMLVVQL